jgi:uncharacterized protein YbjQ (UPF0145 family)
MGFFGRGEAEDSEQAESLKRIERGGIPIAAEERLRGLGMGRLFTSGLSVNEFALLDRMGPRPVAQVMGASVVRVGWQYLPPLAPGVWEPSGAWGSGWAPTPTGFGLQVPLTEPSISQVRNYKWNAEVVCRLDVLSDAWNMVRRRALDRLAEEAMHVGADAVVGVHVRQEDHDLGGGTIEYVVTGTAIRHPGPTRTDPPVLTDVSVQDYWRLKSAGHEPVALVASTAVVFASAPRFTRAQRARAPRQNRELEELSKGFHEARDAVRVALQGQVLDAGGAGVVGVEFSHSVSREKFALASSLQTSDRRGWHRGRFGVPYRVSGHSDVDRRGWVVTMHAAGTAIRPLPGGRQEPVRSALRMRAS